MLLDGSPASSLGFALTSHTDTVWSEFAVARTFPSGLNAIETILLPSAFLMVPDRFASGPMSRNRTVVSAATAARRPLNATDETTPAKSVRVVNDRGCRGSATSHNRAVRELYPVTSM